MLFFPVPELVEQFGVYSEILDTVSVVKGPGLIKKFSVHDIISPSSWKNHLDHESNDRDPYLFAGLMDLAPELNKDDSKSNKDDDLPATTASFDSGFEVQKGPFSPIEEINPKQVEVNWDQHVFDIIDSYALIQDRTHYAANKEKAVIIQDSTDCTATKESAVIIQNSTNITATSEPNIIDGFPQEINNLHFNTDEFHNLDPAVINLDSPQFSKENIGSNGLDGLDDPNRGHLLAASSETYNKKVSEIFMNVPVSKLGFVTPSFLSSLVASMHTPKEKEKLALSIFSRKVPEPVLNTASVNQDDAPDQKDKDSYQMYIWSFSPDGEKRRYCVTAPFARMPREEVPIFGWVYFSGEGYRSYYDPLKESYGVFRYVHVFVLVEFSHGGMAVAHFRLFKKYKVDSSHFPQNLSKRKPDSRGTSGCVYTDIDCFPVQEESNNSIIKWNISRHLFRFYEPDILYWARFGSDGVKAIIKSLDYKSLALLFANGKVKPLKNRFMEYMRQCESVRWSMPGFMG